MPYPPPLPPNDRANTTPTFDNHADDHNTLTDAIAEILNVLGVDPSGPAVDVTARLANLVPVGTIMMYGVRTVPSGWLLCEGQTVDRTTYSELFDVIGTAYGSTTASNFKVPDLRGRAPVGQDTSDALWNTLGEKRGRTDWEIVTHGHADTFSLVANGSHTPTIASGRKAWDMREIIKDGGWPNTDGLPGLIYANSAVLGTGPVSRLGWESSFDPYWNNGAITFNQVPNHNHTLNGKVSNAGNTTGTNQNIQPSIAVPFMIRAASS